MMRSRESTGESRPHDGPVPVADLLWTDTFEPPWLSGDDVLISAVGSREIIQETVSRLLETSPETGFRLMTNAAVETPLPTSPLGPQWDPSCFSVDQWSSILFLTDNENHPDHRNALAFLVQRCEFRQAFLCESHFALIDITRHARTPARDGRVSRVFFYLEPETWSYLYDSARDLAGPGVALEIGSYVGGAAVALAAGSREGRHPPAVAVDPVLVEGWYAAVRESGCRSAVIPVVTTSKEAARTWPAFAREHGLPTHIRLLFLDGDHEFDAVLLDLELWSRHVTAGGRIVVHDAYNPFHPGVARALHRWLSREPAWRIVNHLPEAVVCGRI